MLFSQETRWPWLVAQLFSNSSFSEFCSRNLYHDLQVNFVYVWGARLGSVGSAVMAGESLHGPQTEKPPHKKAGAVSFLYFFFSPDIWFSHFTSCLRSLVISISFCKSHQNFNQNSSLTAKIVIMKCFHTVLWSPLAGRRPRSGYDLSKHRQGSTKKLKASDFDRTREKPARRRNVKNSHIPMNSWMFIKQIIYRVLQTTKMSLPAQSGLGWKYIYNDIYGNSKTTNAKYTMILKIKNKEQSEKEVFERTEKRSEEENEHNRAFFGCFFSASEHKSASRIGFRRLLEGFKRGLQFPGAYIQNNIHHKLRQIHSLEFENSAKKNTFRVSHNFWPNCELTKLDEKEGFLE